VLKPALIKTTGNGKNCYSAGQDAVLMVKKLTLFMPKDKIPQGILIHVHANEGQKKNK
jgi:hypothetical protein